MNEKAKKSIEELDAQLDELFDSAIELARKDYAAHADDPNYDPLTVALAVNDFGEVTVNALAGEPGKLLPQVIEMHKPYGYVLAAPAYARMGEPGMTVEQVRNAPRQEIVMFTLETHNRMRAAKAPVTRNPTAMGEVEEQPYDSLGGRMVHLLR